MQSARLAINLARARDAARRTYNRRLATGIATLCDVDTLAALFNCLLCPDAEPRLDDETAAAVQSLFDLLCEMRPDAVHLASTGERPEFDAATYSQFGPRADADSVAAADPAAESPPDENGIWHEYRTPDGTRVAGLLR